MRYNGFERLANEMTHATKTTAWLSRSFRSLGRVNCDAASRNEPPVPPSSVSLGCLGLAVTGTAMAPSAVTTTLAVPLARRPALRDVFGTGRTDGRTSRMALGIANRQSAARRSNCEPTRWQDRSDRAPTGRLEIKRFLPHASWCGAAGLCFHDAAT